MNVFQYAFSTEENWKRNLEDMTSFRPQYTFYSDFGIAEFYEVLAGETGAVKDTYERVVESWGGDIKPITEVAMVLNHKAWSFAEGVDSSYLNCGETWRVKLAELYTDLYYKCVDFIHEKYGKDSDAMSYFYEVTD